MMATNVATGLVIEGESHIRPVTWDEWITLAIRPQDNAVRTVRGPIRVPTVIVAVNYAKVPKKRPKLCARAIRERDGNRCQYTGRVLRPDEGSMDHVLPRSRGGKNAWENLVWAGKDVNARKGNRLPHEAGLKLLSVPRAPKELPASATTPKAAIRWASCCDFSGFTGNEVIAAVYSSRSRISRRVIRHAGWRAEPRPENGHDDIGFINDLPVNDALWSVAQFWVAVGGPVLMFDPKAVRFPVL